MEKILILAVRVIKPYTRRDGGESKGGTEITYIPVSFLDNTEGAQPVKLWASQPVPGVNGPGLYDADVNFVQFSTRDGVQFRPEIRHALWLGRPVLDVLKPNGAGAAQPLAVAGAGR